MPKVCIYLPDRLHAEARRLDLSLSALTQEAVERAVAQDERARWVRTQASRTLRRGALPHPDPWSPRSGPGSPPAGSATVAGPQR